MHMRCDVRDAMVLWQRGSIRVTKSFALAWGFVWLPVTARGMGHAHSRTRYGPVASQHLRPQGLYACHSVSHKQLKHLRYSILTGALAPCYPGSCAEADEARPLCCLLLYGARFWVFVCLDCRLEGICVAATSWSVSALLYCASPSSAAR